MKRNILWLDDYFEEFGELTLQTDYEVLADRDKISRRLPNTNIHSETTLSGFIQKVLDHERLVRKLEPKNPNPCIFDAIIIDVMIDNATGTQIPRFDETGRRIAFRDNGLPIEWDILQFNQNGNDAGLKLAQYFIQKLDSMNNTAIIFYTHRPINSELSQTIGRIKNARIVDGFQKMKGIEPVYKLLELCGLS